MEGKKNFNRSKDNLSQSKVSFDEKNLIETKKSNKSLVSEFKFENTNTSNKEYQYSNNHYSSIIENLSLTNSNLINQNVEFINEWVKQKNIYSKIQVFFLTFNIVISIIMLALSIWINLSAKFCFITNIGNKIYYTSLNRIIGLLPLMCLIIFLISVILDLSQILLFVYVKKFLNSHTINQINTILNNQKYLARLSIANDQKQLQLRNKIRKRVDIVLTSLKTLNYMFFFMYIFIILSSQYFIGIFVHYKFSSMINYELPQTLMKLIKQYEKNQMEFLNSLDKVIMMYRNANTKTIEDNLIDEMHRNFECCNYQNPFQFGDLAPSSCNFQRGCLKPIQEFVWYYIYFSVLLLLFAGSLKFCIQFVLFINFQIQLLRKLLKNLYEYDFRNFNFDDDEIFDEKEKLKREIRLKEIRRQKELLLQQEEEEEERLKLKEEEEYLKLIEHERKQNEYEKMLFEQNRFEELKFQRLQRKIQLQHELDKDEELSHF